MHRTAIIAAAFVASACSFSAEKPVVEVEQTMSGLEFGGVSFPDQDIKDGQPTYMALGTYEGTVVEVLRPSKYQTDVYEGSKMTIDVDEASNGDDYIFNGNLQVTGVSGRLQGASVEEIKDGSVDCFMVIETRVQGRAGTATRFGLQIRETVTVEGSECAYSNMGEERVDELVYRVRFVSESL
jgi:hypothetical protein